MNRTRTAVWAVMVLVLAWATLVFADLKPTHYPDYRRSAVQTAQSAYDATRSGWLAGREALAGRAFGTFTTAAFDDASKALAGAVGQFAAEAPPDDRSRQLRDELSRLLAADVTLLQDASSASDDAALRTAVQGLDQVAGKLSDFIEAHR